MRHNSFSYFVGQLQLNIHWALNETLRLWNIYVLWWDCELQIGSIHPGSWTKYRLLLPYIPLLLQSLTRLSEFKLPSVKALDYFQVHGLIAGNRVLFGFCLMFFKIKSLNIKVYISLSSWKIETGPTFPHVNCQLGVSGNCLPQTVPGLCTLHQSLQLLIVLYLLPFILPAYPRRYLTR